MAAPVVVYDWSFQPRRPQDDLPDEKRFELLVLVDLGAGLTSAVTGLSFAPTPSSELPVRPAGLLSAGEKSRLDDGTLGFKLFSIATLLVDDGVGGKRNETDVEVLARIETGYPTFKAEAIDEWNDRWRYYGFRDFTIPGEDI
jgi:hypothetical protein